MEPRREAGFDSAAVHLPVPGEPLCPYDLALILRSSFPIEKQNGGGIGYARFQAATGLTLFFLSFTTFRCDSFL
jgi:hypothetical protein